MTKRWKTRPVRSAATKYWAFTIQGKMDGASAFSMQKKVDIVEGETSLSYKDRCDNWMYKKLNGSPTTTKHRLVIAFDNEFPGTLSLLTHPLWNILEKPNASGKNLDIWCRDLPKETRPVLAGVGKQTKYSVTFPTNEIDVESIAACNSLDALCALLILIRAMKVDINHDQKLLYYTQSLAHKLTTRFCVLEPIRKFAEEFYHLVFERFIRLDYQNLNTLLGSYDQALKYGVSIGISGQSKSKQLEFLNWVQRFHVLDGLFGTMDHWLERMTDMEMPSEPEKIKYYLEHIYKGSFPDEFALSLFR